jgi:hypothetical protein
MPRLVEILLFVLPFVAFAAWRVLFPSPLPPRWLIAGLAAAVALMLLALIWVRRIDAEDANQSYRPAELREGRVVPAGPGSPQ